MADLNKAIDEALDAEDRGLLAREPGFVAQVGMMFTGRLGWVAMVMMVAQTAIFVAGVWMAWRFYQATEVLEALRWGLPSVVLLVCALILKTALWPTLEANRVLREVKRVELRLAKLQRE